MERGDRPWGYYLVLQEGDGFKVKQFVVRPGHRLSLQRHRRRSEHWHVVRGACEVTRDGESMVLRSGGSIDIPVGSIHRVACMGTDDLVVIEVQHGDYVGEDDIERIEDDYGRGGRPDPDAIPERK